MTVLGLPAVAREYWRTMVLFTAVDRLLGNGQPIPDRGGVDRILVVLNGIHNQDVFWSDLRKQDRNVSLVAKGTWGDGIQSMYEQPRPFSSFARLSRSDLIFPGIFEKLV